MKTAALILMLAASTAQAKELVIFTADWCGACQKLKDDLQMEPDAKEYSQSIVDYDQQPELARHYGVRTLPTLIVLDDNREVRRKVGHDSREKLRLWLQGRIGNP